MSTFEETRKKLLEKYGKPSSNSENTTKYKVNTSNTKRENSTTSSPLAKNITKAVTSSVRKAVNSATNRRTPTEEGLKEFDKYRETLLNKYDRGIDNISEAETLKWFKDADSVMAEMKRYTESAGDKYDLNYGSEMAEKLSNTINASYNVAQYLRNHKNELKDYESLRDALSMYQSDLNRHTNNINKVRKYYSQWENEEAYNTEMAEYEKYLKEQAKIEAMPTLDLDAEYKALEEKKTQLEEYKSAKSKLDAEYKSRSDELMTSSERKAYLEEYQNAIKDLNDKYGKIDIDALEYEINQQEIYLGKAQKIQSANKTNNEVLSRDDFEKLSAVKETSPTANFGVTVFGNWYGNGDRKYDYINDLGYAQTLYTDDTEMLLKYSTMTEDEVSVYNYLYNTEGKESANKYLADLDSTLNERYMGEYKEMWSKMATEHPVPTSALSIPTNLVGGGLGYLDVASQHISNAFTGEDKPIDYNRGGMKATAMSSTVRETVAKNIADATGTINLSEKEHPVLSKLLNGKSLGDVYQLGMSMADSSAVALVTSATGLNPIFGTMLLGGSAASQGVLDAVERGASDEEAIMMGTLNGVFEALFEKYSIENLVNGNTRNIVKAFLKQGAIEGSEEVFTSFANNIADILVMAENSNYRKNVEAYIEAGMSREQANGQALLDTAVDLGWDFIGGFLSGGIMGSIKTAAGNHKAKVVYGDKNSTALLDEALEIDPEDEYAKKLKERVEGGKKLRAEHYATLVDNKSAKLLQQDEETIKGTVREKLTAYGETSNIEALSEVLLKQAKGERLNSYDKSLLANSKYGQRVSNELSKENIENGGYNTEWAKNLGTNSINPDLYNRIVYAVNNNLKADAHEENLARGINVPTTNEAKKGTEAKETASTESFDVSVDGKVTLSGEEVEIEEVSSVKGGKMVVRLKDGTNVSADSLAYSSADESVLYGTVQEIATTPSQANEIINGFEKSGMTIKDYNRGIRIAHLYGKNSLPMADLEKSGNASKLPLKVREAAYKAGMVMGGKDVARANAVARRGLKTASGTTRNGGVFFGLDSSNVSNIRDYIKSEGKTLNATQESGIVAMEMMSKALGVEYYVFESYLNKNGSRVYTDENGIERPAPNGYYENNKVYIDLNAGAKGDGLILYTVAHEMTHFIRKWSPAKFKVLANAVIEHSARRGQRIDDLIDSQIAKAKRDNRDIGYDEALEEVIADSMESILADGKVLEMMTSIKQKDESLWSKIKEWFKDLADKLKSIISAYEGATPDSYEGKMVANMKDIIGQLESLYTEGLIEASANFNAAMESVIKENATEIESDEILTEGAVVTDGNGRRYSIKSMNEDIAEGKMFEDLKTVCGWSQTEVDNLKKDLKELIEYMTPNRNILDMNETYGREGRKFSPYKDNSDPLYKISMDFSTLCSKRLLTQFVIENLQVREKRPMSAEEQLAIRDMLIEYGKKEKALQVACAMCYVEAARLKSPKQMERWLSDPVPHLLNYLGKKNKEFKAKVEKAQEDFKESRGYDRNATKSEIEKHSRKDRTELDKIGPRMRLEYKPSAEEQAIIERAKALPPETYLTAGNLAELSANKDTEVIYKAYSEFIRNATRSKPLHTDEPYYYGDSTRDNGNGIIVTDRFIENVNRENGMRFSSWSDWRIQHLLDYITSVIDLSVRGAAMHGYTKFGDEVRVLGNTGMMFNMSGVAGSQNGLNEDGSLNFSPTESIDYEEAKALRKEFPETAGLQCIGVGDEHIRKLLESDEIDYVIPYHTSGLNAVLRRMVNIYGWKDYTGTQNAKVDKSIKFEDAVDQEHWHEEPVFSEFFVGYDANLSGIEAMRKSADKYVQMCRDRGLTPKFAQFYEKGNNYWKLLIDRKMINQVTGNLIQQRAVTPTFDFATIKKVVDKYVDNYDSGLEARALKHIEENWDSVPQRIKDLKKAKANEKGKKKKKALDALANETLAAQPRKNSSRDSEGKELSKEQAEFFKDSKVRDADGNLLVVHHGTPNKFYTFRQNIAAGWGRGIYFTDNVEDASEYGDNIVKAYLNIKKPYLADAMNYNSIGAENTKAYIEFDKKVWKQRYDEYDTYEEYKEDGMGVDMYEIYEEEIEVFNKILRELGYDGIIANGSNNINGLEIVAFDETQVKETTNTNPTTDPDIRYSSRNSVTFNGKPFWSGSVNLLDGVIEEVHTIEEAEAVDFHHSLYFSDSQVEKLDSGENAFFWVDGGVIEGDWRESISQNIIKKIEAQIKKRDVSYSTRDALTDEEVLKRASEGMKIEDLTKAEKDALDIFKKRLANVEKLQAERKELGKEFKKVAFKQKEREQILEKMRTAEKDIEKAKADLLKVKQAKVLQRVLKEARKIVTVEERNRVKEMLYEKFDKKEQRIRADFVEKKTRAEEHRKDLAQKKAIKQKIRKTIMELDKLLNRGDKKKNVKEEMKGLVSEALRSYDILYIDAKDIKNEDLLRAGIGTQLTPEERKNVDDATAMLKQIYSSTTGADADELVKKFRRTMAKLSDVFVRERTRVSETKVSEVLSKLADSYKELEESQNEYVRDGYHEVVHQFLEYLKKEVGGTLIRDMSANQLEELYQAYKMVLTTVRNANNLFAENLKESREVLANRTLDEVNAMEKHGLWGKVGDAVSRYAWNNLKPIYAFEKIGSNTLTTLYKNVRDGQNVWSRDFRSADEFRKAVEKKYDFNSWDMDKTYTFTSSSGTQFDLSLQQIMSLYAYSKREQAFEHLLKGGIVFESGTEVVVKKNGIKMTYLNKNATAHQISFDVLNEIISDKYINKEQKAYVDEMQEYLSSTMGGKGNEVTMKLYGVELFGEKNYFPLRSAGQYMAKAKETDLKKEQGQVSLINAGFSKKITPKANNPIVLSNFNEVWSGHVNDMSMYHAFVLPLEDFRKVYEYKTPNVEGETPLSINSALQNVFGDSATKYIDQLIKDINGGVLVDPRESIGKNLISKFKKASVMGSASVVIQQPSAIGRAFAEINPKYFLGERLTTRNHKEVWEEVKKYSPVAFIKEMGYFDVGMGKGPTDYLMTKEYDGVKDKAKALLKDKEYRGKKLDDAFGKLPALADEFTWCAIWNAVKREVKANNKNLAVNSEEFLNKCGERFTDIIDKTQVYDSVFSRSANMRSKSVYMNMLTSFLAEPTTSINMLGYALDKIKKGDKKTAIKTIASVYTSLLLNSMLVSLVYAARDDDEDETFLEKYVSSFSAEMVDGINPISYLPFIKDMWSVMQGYDVERADMSLVSDLTSKMTNLIKLWSTDTSDMSEDALNGHNEKLTEAYWGVLDYTAAMLGLPMKNIRRDINGAFNLTKTLGEDFGGRETSWGSLMDKTWESVKKTLPIIGWMPNEKKTDKLYKAIINGDTVYANRIKGSYDTESALQSAMKKALQDNDPRVIEAAVASYEGDNATLGKLAKEIIGEGNFTQEMVMKAINSEVSKLEPDTNDGSASAKKLGIYDMDNFAKSVIKGDSVTARIKEDIINTKVKNGSTREDAEKSFISSAKTKLKDLYLEGEINEAKVISTLTNYCDMDIEEADEWLEKIDFSAEYGLSYDDKKTAYKNGEISSAEYVDILVNYEGKSREEALEVVAELDYEVEYPELSKTIGYSYYKKWEAEGKAYGVDFEVFTDVATFRDDGSSKSATPQDEVWDYINSLNISDSQKDGLHLCFYKESTLKNTPWNK